MLRSSGGTQGSLEDDIATLLTESGLERLVRTEVRVAGRARPLNEIARRELHDMVREALTNVARHAHARTVVTQVRYGILEFSVAVTDDGRGFTVAEPDRGPGHWGLVGLKERAVSIGAKVTIASRVGAGTSVRIVVGRWQAYRRQSTPPR